MGCGGRSGFSVFNTCTIATPLPASYRPPCAAITNKWPAMQAVLASTLFLGVSIISPAVVMPTDNKQVKRTVNRNAALFKLFMSSFLQFLARLAAACLLPFSLSACRSDNDLAPFPSKPSLVDFSVPVSRGKWMILFFPSSLATFLL